MELPLFPLETVLFPGMALPLHVFEERYQLMIGRCLEYNEPFGVVLIKSGVEVGGPAVPCDIGTTARILHVQRLDGGRINLLTVGMRRFRTGELRQIDPYLVADVDILDDEEQAAEGVAETAEQVAALFAEYYKLTLALSDQWVSEVALPTRPASVSDYVGGRIDVDNQVKQELLETLSVSRRLELELDLLVEAIQELAPRVLAARRQKYSGFGVLN
jgi:Lon protease-like protein